MSPPRISIPADCSRHADGLEAHDYIEPPVSVDVARPIAVRRCETDLEGLQNELRGQVVKPASTQDRILPSVPVQVGCRDLLVLGEGRDPLPRRCAVGRRSRHEQLDAVAGFVPAQDRLQIPTGRESRDRDSPEEVAFASAQSFRPPDPSPTVSHAEHEVSAHRVIPATRRAQDVEHSIPVEISRSGRIPRSASRLRRFQRPRSPGSHE